MTEYKILLYYDKPMPEYFTAAMEQELKAAVESGILTGYEFEKTEMPEELKIMASIQRKAEQIKKDFEGSLKDEKTGNKNDTPGHDPGAEKGAPVVHDKRKARGTKPEHQAVRPDPTDNGKKEG